jgi:hypothetical protein
VRASLIQISARNKKPPYFRLQGGLMKQRLSHFGHVCTVLLFCALYCLVHAGQFYNGGDLDGSLTKSKFWLPMVTNLNSSKQFSEGGEEPYPANDYGAYPQRDYNAWREMNWCRSTIAVGQSSGDIYLPNSDLVKLAKFFEGKGFGLNILHDTTQIEEGIDAFQLIPNVVFNASHPMLATICLPAGWTKSGSYPIFFSGDHYPISNTIRLFHDWQWNPSLPASYDFQIAAKCKEGSRQGAILVITNCGGAEAFGIQKEAFTSVGLILDYIGNSLAGDLQKVVFYGKSRGALTALAWGCNPLGKNYRTVAIFGQAPFVAFGSTVTYPHNALNGFSYGWGEIYGNADALKEIDAQPLDYLKRTTGYQTAAEADSNSGIGLLDEAKENANIGLIFMSLGTKDSWVPYYLSHAYHNKAASMGFNIRSQVHLGGGHWANALEFFGALLDFAGEMADGKSLSEITQIDKFKPGKYFFTYPNKGNQTLTSATTQVQATCIPASVRIPFRMRKGQGAVIEVVGQPDDEINVQLTGTDISLTGTIGEECYVLKEFTVNQSGTFGWSINVGGKQLDGNNTPFNGLALQLEVKDAITADPAWGDYACNGEWIWERGYGVDQYSDFSTECDQVQTSSRILDNKGTGKNTFSVLAIEGALRISGFFWNKGIIHSVMVFSMAGKMVANLQVSSASKNRFELALPNIIPGAYMARIRGQNVDAMQKVVIK